MFDPTCLVPKTLFCGLLISRLMVDGSEGVLVQITVMGMAGLRIEPVPGEVMVKAWIVVSRERIVGITVKCMMR